MNCTFIRLNKVRSNFVQYYLLTAPHHKVSAPENKAINYNSTKSNAVREKKQMNIIYPWYQQKKKEVHWRSPIHLLKVAIGHKKFGQTIFQLFVVLASCDQVMHRGWWCVAHGFPVLNIFSNIILYYGLSDTTTLNYAGDDACVEEDPVHHVSNCALE